MSAHHDDHGEHAHRPVWHYLLIAAVLTAITLFEIGPLFGWYNLPGVVLVLLSVVKFAVVVALFMHLYDDSRVFTAIFVPALFGGTAMVLVLMLLFWGYMPSPHKDSIPVQQRYWTDYSGPCNAWIRSSVSNRWYCSSPPIDPVRFAAYNPPAAAAPGCSSGLKLDLTGKTEEESKVAMVEAGGKLFEQNCMACHMATGLGVPGAFPPLAGSDFIEDPAKHAHIIVHGLSGAITVNGAAFNGVMAAFGGLCDEEIASIATYERNSWGNSMGIVTPKQVAAAR